MSSPAASALSVASAPALAGRAAAPAAPQAANPRTRAALEEFESVLISEMVNLMFSTVETDTVFGGGQAEEIYRSMMGQEMGREIAKRGGLGLTPALMNEVIRMQGGN